jgi:UDPglucose 6-dehydrogenase
MKVCVMGLWHLGSVTAACLASVGQQVVGFDFDETVITNLQNGQPPLYEPGLEDLVKSGLKSGSLSFTTDPARAFHGAEMAWVTFDTPVDEDDHADVDYVLDRVKKVLPYLEPSTLVLISSQVPVGSTRQLEIACSGLDKRITFAYSPENLRLGKAIEVFTYPDRIVIGIRSEGDKEKVKTLLAPITDKIEWMSVESAEMTKHALNAFLATSVVFINEIATLCESVGADAKEVERALKSEARIGPKAYLGPGGAFAGGTLARDIAFLIDSGVRYQQPTFLFSAVKASNDAHKLWPRRKLEQHLGNLKGKVIAVWGLTYKPGTDTLRRSSSVELARWLVEQGAIVQAHDPVVISLPENLASIHLCPTPEEAIQSASALVIATEWPDYRQINPDIFLTEMGNPLILDPNAFILRVLNNISQIKYISVGQAQGDR